MEFGNPIIGLEELIRSAIRSRNFVTGVSGWRIAQDGTAEFSSAVIRGVGNGQIVIVGQAGGPQVILAVSGTAGLVELPTNSPVENQIAKVLAQRGNAGAINEFLSMRLYGPSVDGAGATDQINVQLNSQNNDGSSNANFSVNTLNHGSLMVADYTKFQIVPPLETNAVTSTDITADTIALQSASVAFSVSADSVSVTNLVSAGSVNVSTYVERFGESWHGPSYSANWSGATTLNGNTGFRTLQYRKTAEDEVWLLGGATAGIGAGGTIFTLPSGYFNGASRHLVPTWIYHSATSAVSAGFAQVTETGLVNIANSIAGVTIGSGDQVFLNGKFPLGNIT